MDTLSVKLYLHLFTIYAEYVYVCIYIYMCVYVVIHIKCVEVNLVETLNPPFLVNI